MSIRLHTVAGSAINAGVVVERHMAPARVVVGVKQAANDGADAQFLTQFTFQRGGWLFIPSKQPAWEVPGGRTVRMVHQQYTSPRVHDNSGDADGHFVAKDVDDEVLRA